MALTTVLYVLLAILLFGVLIFVHELGHFITAKLCGVRVNEFALFMGPAIWQKQKGETLYSLRCIPIGGYCAMEGEDGDSDDPRSFAAAKPWKRFLILVAGAGMNFVIGFLMVVLYVSILAGTYNNGLITRAQISDIYENRPFAEQLQAGDEFYEVNGRRVFVSGDVGMLLDREADGVHDIVVIRSGEKVTLSGVVMKRDYTDEYGRKLYGLAFATEEANVGTVLAESWNQSLNFGRLVWMSLGDLITGRESVKNLSGPVGVIDVVAEVGTNSETTGWALMNILYLFAFIAINLGVMNLLPIPALDGGRVAALLITTLLEKIFRRKIDPKYEGYVHGFFMLLLMLLMLVIVFKDVWWIFKK